MAMKVVITGASGRMGFDLCRALCHAGGYDVTAVDRVERKGLLVPITKAELLDPQSAFDVLEGADVLVHLANHRGMGEAPPRKLLNDNLAINMNVFFAARERAVRKVIFASSIQIICGTRDAGDGRPESALPYLPLDRDTPQNPGNAYALSKHLTERLLEHVCRESDLQGIAVRFPAVLDKGYITRTRRELRVINAKLDEAFTYMTYGDMCSMVMALLHTDLPGYRMYLAASRNNYLDMEPARLIRKYYENVPLRKPIDEIETLVDTSVLGEETGWEPKDR